MNTIKFTNDKQVIRDRCLTYNYDFANSLFSCKRPTTIHKIFETNCSFHVNKRTAEKV